MPTLEQEFNELIRKGDEPLQASFVELISALKIIFEKVNVIKGDKGDQGEQGDQGIKGEKGEKGERGERGLQGLQGEKGENGIDGKDGRDGKNGLDGIAGKDFDPTILEELLKEFRVKIENIQPRQRFFGASVIVKHIDEEVPVGAINGSNVTFTLVRAPNPALSLKLSLNGARQRSGTGNDFTLSARTITMATAPLTNSVLLADYRY